MINMGFHLNKNINQKLLKLKYHLKYKSLKKIKIFFFK